MGIQEEINRLNKRQEELLPQIEQSAILVNQFQEEFNKISARNSDVLSFEIIQSIQKRMQDLIWNYTSIIDSARKLNSSLFYDAKHRITNKGQLPLERIRYEEMETRIQQASASLSSLAKTINTIFITNKVVETIVNAFSVFYSISEYASDYVPYFLEEEKRKYQTEYDKRKEAYETAFQKDNALKEELQNIKQQLLEYHRQQDEEAKEKEKALEDSLSHYQLTPNISFNDQDYSKTEIPLSFFYENSKVKSLNTWDLNKKGILYLKLKAGSEEKTSLSSSFIQMLMLQIIATYPIDKINFSLCSTSKDLIAFVSRFENKNDAAIQCQRLIYKGESHINRGNLINNEAEGIENAIQHARNLVNERIGKEKDVLTFNQENVEKALPLFFLILDRYGNDMYSRSALPLKEIFEEAKGQKAGVFVIVIDYDEKEGPIYGTKIPTPWNENDYEKKDILAYSLENKDGKLILEDEKGSSLANTYKNGEFTNEELNAFLVSLTNQFRQIDSIRLLPLLEKEEQRRNCQPKEDFSIALSTPLGYANGEVDYFLTKATIPHAIVSGRTATGKSSIAQNIILGLSYLYSPDEVKFWLLDFKDGATFSLFKDLKHVKLIAKSEKMMDVLEMLDDIKQEMTNRSRLITGAGCQNLVEYNSKHPNEKLPRVIIFIDEAQVIDNQTKSMTKLINIARQGRSYGVDLVIASQFSDSSTYTNFSDLMGQITQRFIFDNPDSTIRKFAEDHNTPEDNYFIRTIPFSCLHMQKGSQQALRLKPAFAGSSEEIQDLVTLINEKWSSFANQKPFVLDVPEREVHDAPYYHEMFLAMEPKFDESTFSFAIPLGKGHLDKNIHSFTFSENNPCLMLFGDANRASSTEYMIAQYFSLAKPSDPSAYQNQTKVYYLDLKMGLSLHSEMKNLLQEMPNTSYGKGQEASKLLYDLYQEIERRQNEISDISQIAPIQLILHHAENIQRFFKTPLVVHASSDDNRKLPSSAFNFSSLSGATDLDLEIPDGEIIDDEPFNQIAVETEESIEPLTLLREILSIGASFGVYTTLYFGVDSIFNFKQTLDLDSPAFQSAMVLPTLINDPNKKISSNEIVRFLQNTGSDQLDSIRDIDMSNVDTIYAALIIGEELNYRLIPFELEKKEK